MMPPMMNKKPMGNAPMPLPPAQNPSTRLESAALSGNEMNVSSPTSNVVNSVKSKLMQAKRSMPGVGFKAPMSAAAKGVKKAMAKKPKMMMQ